MSLERRTESSEQQNTYENKPWPAAFAELSGVVFVKDKQLSKGNTEEPRLTLAATSQATPGLVSDVKVLTCGSLSCIRLCLAAGRLREEALSSASSHVPPVLVLLS